MRSWIISINHLRKEIKLWIFERKWQIGFWCKGGHEHIGRKWTARFRIHFTLFLAPFPFGRFAEMIDDNKHSKLELCLVAACARTSSEKSCMRVGGTWYQIQPEAIFISFVCSNSNSARSLSGHPFHFNCPYLLNISHYYLNILCIKLFIAAQEHQTNAKWLMLAYDFTK